MQQERQEQQQHQEEEEEPCPSSSSSNGLAVDGADVVENDNNDTDALFRPGSSNRRHHRRRHVVEEDPDPEVANVTEFKVYKSRWYILGVFSTLGLLQGMVWNTFGPLSDAVLTIYCPEWTPATLALYGNWGNIMYVIPVLPVMYYFQTHGLRASMLLTAGLMTVGTLVRCLPFKITAFTWMCHICAIMNGISGIIVFAAASALSVSWFPPSERTTATALAIVFNNMGNAVSFILGPAIVPDPKYNSTDVHRHHHHHHLFYPYRHRDDEYEEEQGKELTLSVSPAYDNSSCRNITDADRELVENRVSILMYTEFALVAVCFLAIAAYFPSKPKLPPSLASSIDRMDFKPALLKLCSNRNSILMTVCFSLFNGLVASWYSVMVITFRQLPLGDDKDMTVGYIGMWAVVGNSFSAILASRIIDSIKGKMKSCLLVIMILAAICWVWVGLLALKIIPFSLLQLNASTILASSLTFAAGPIFFEFTSELVYPVPEGVVGGFLTCFYNVVGMIFLFLFDIPSLAASPDWIIYSIIFATVVPIPLLLLVKEEYNRSVIDQFQEPRSTISDHASYPEID